MESTLSRAFKVVEGAGGKVTATAIEVPAQEPQAATLEQWDARHAHEAGRAGRTRLGVDGRLDRGHHGSPGGERSGTRRRTAPGAEASLTFEGTGVAIVGSPRQEGGRADVYLDGKKAGEIDAWIPERTHDNDAWHVRGLPAGKHTVRIVTRGDADSGSKGKKTRIDWAVVYGAAAR